MKRPSSALVVAVAALLVAIGGTAVAAIGAIPADGRFTACYQTSDSILNRIVLFAEPGEQCPSSYARVSWPAQASGSGGGAPGPQGPAGPQGPPGPAGQQGPPGPPSKSAAGKGFVASVAMREVTTTGGPVIVRCGGIGKRRYAVGGGGAIIAGGSYRIASSYPVGDESRRPNGWAVGITGTTRYTTHVPGSQTSSKTIGGAFAGGHTHQYNPGSRLLPLDGFGKPAVVRVFAICARVD